MPVCHFISCLCHACVSHLLRGQHHHLECYYRNFLIGTHMCVHPVSEWSVYFTLQCELFPSCNVSNNTSLLSARTRGGGGQPNVDRPGQREGDPKDSQICADILYGWPLCEKCLSFNSHQYYIPYLWKNNKLFVAQIPKIIKWNITEL